MQMVLNIHNTEGHKKKTRNYPDMEISVLESTQQIETR